MFLNPGIPGNPGIEILQSRNPGIEKKALDWNPYA